MNARVIFAALILSTTLFAGCLGGDGGSPSSTTTTSAGAGPTGTNSTGGANGTNEAPVVLLKVLQNSTEVAAANGSYAVDPSMNVTLDASASTDADGDELVFLWTVNETDLDSDGGVVELALSEGNHSIELVVSDGQDESTISILVVAGSSGPVGDAAIVTEITGSFAQGDDDTKTVLKPFEVPKGAKQISIWATWDDGVLGNNPLITDIDIFLLNPDGDEVAKAETSDFEYIRVNDSEALVPGTWNIKLLPYGDGVAGAPVIPVDTAYTVNVMVWMVEPKVVAFTGSVQGGVHVGGPADTASKTHTVDLATGPGIVTARLTWSNIASEDAGSAVRRTNDYDLSVTLAGDEIATSGNGMATEFAFEDAEASESLAAGALVAEVIPFEILTADYVLTIEYT